MSRRYATQAPVASPAGCGDSESLATATLPGQPTPRTVQTHLLVPRLGHLFAHKQNKPIAQKTKTTQEYAGLGFNTPRQERHGQASQERHDEAGVPAARATCDQDAGRSIQVSPQASAILVPRGGCGDVAPAPRRSLPNRPAGFPFWLSRVACHARVPDA